MWILASVLLLGVGILSGLRWVDGRVDEKARRELIETAGPSPGVYDPDMVLGLPDAAQRYFNFSIAAGTRLEPAVELEMHGDLGLGSIDDPGYKPMSAQQVLAPPHGLVWRVRTGAISGSDGVTAETSWTRFWLFGFIPVVRVSGNDDHHRSAFGRVVAEGAFWAPATLLPGEHVQWEPVDASTARATVTYGKFVQQVDLTVEPSGQPQQVVILRWSNENAGREFRLQPFGGYLSDFRQFGSYRLPTTVEGGNHFGTDDYFPFYKARVVKIRFPGSR